MIKIGMGDVVASKLAIVDKNCDGCGDDRKLNQTDGCCDLKRDDDGLYARCVGEWSADKHHYFERYCDIFAKGMKKKWSNLAVIDLFAGPVTCSASSAQS